MTTNNQINTLMTATPTANASSLWDANKNLSSNSFLAGYATTATAAGTTTLVVGSAWQQFFTGSTTQIVVMPVTSTLVLGQSFYIVNNSSGNVTVNSSGGNAIQVMGASTTLLITCISTSGTTAASWSIEYVGASSGGTVSNGTINDLAYYAATGTTVSPLATANNGLLVTSNTGVPSILAGPGSANLTLLSQAAAAPIWSTNPVITQVNVQVITATGAYTYTPTTGTKYAFIELQGAGGGSGGSTGAASQSAVSGPGAGGSYYKLFATAAQLGTGITGNVGAGGTPGSSGNNAGGAGGNTTAIINGGSTWTAAGGGPGGGQASSAAVQIIGTVGVSNANTAGTNASIVANIPGAYGAGGFSSGAVEPLISGSGGQSHLGQGGAGQVGNALPLGGGTYGGGAGGGPNGSGGSIAGAAGGAGVVIVTEFISA